MKIGKTNNQALLAALRETLRYGLFLGTFAGGFCTVEETIAALGGSRRFGSDTFLSFFFPFFFSPISSSLIY